MTAHHTFVTLLVAVFAVSCSDGAGHSDFIYVWPDEMRDEMNVTMAFQLDKSFDADEAVLKLNAANGYMIFQNDEMVAFGPARSPHGYVRTDEIVLTGLSKDTKLTVDVIANNVNSFCYPDEKPYFAAEVFSHGKIIADTRDFSCFHLNDRIQKVERFSFQRDFAEAYRMSEDRSLFYNGDRTFFPEYAVTSAGRPEVLTRNAPYPEYRRFPMTIVENGTVSIDEDQPVWHVRFIDNISDSTSKGFTRDELELCISDEVSKLLYSRTGDGSNSVSAGTYSVADAGRTLTGWFDLRLNVTEPSVFYVFFDEIDLYEQKKAGEGININYKRNECVGAVRYELEPGSYHLVNFEQISARYLKIVCVKGAFDISSTELISFENPDMYRLEFDCADDSLNAIVKASQNTLAQNAVDLFTDCPQRERAGWLCDSFFSSRAEFLMTGENIIDMCFLENYALAPQLKELPDGMIPMCYPSDHINGEYIPNWSMWYVLQLYEYFQHTGDRAMVDLSRPKVEGLVEFFKHYESPEGLLENLDSWVFVEWSKANDFVDGINFPTNMLYSRMLICAGELYGDSGLVAKGKAMKKKIADLSFNGTFFEDNMIRENGTLVHTGNISETCQYYAFFFGIADPKSQPELFNTLLESFGADRDDSKVFPYVYKSNSFVGNYLRMEILRQEHMTAGIISECKDFFNYMAARTSTLWEHTNPVLSLNHGYASYAANFIITAVTGIYDYDAASNTMTLIEPGLKMNCHAVIPIAGDRIVVDFKDDHREILFPEWLKVVKP